MVYLDVGQVTDSVASDQLMLPIHELHVSFDELLSLLAHLVGFAGKLGRLASIGDASDHLSL